MFDSLIEITVPPDWFFISIRFVTSGFTQLALGIIGQLQMLLFVSGSTQVVALNTKFPFSSMYIPGVCVDGFSITKAPAGAMAVLLKQAPFRSILPVSVSCAII